MEANLKQSICRLCLCLFTWLMLFDLLAHLASAQPMVNHTAIVNNTTQLLLLNLLSDIIPSIRECLLKDVLQISVNKEDGTVSLHLKLDNNPNTTNYCPFLTLSSDNSSGMASNNSIDKDFEFKNNDNDKYTHSGLPITIKQTIVFTVCGAIIGGFFLVAAIMRFRNRLRKTLHKRRLVEKEAKREKSDQKIERRLQPDVLDPLTELYECASQKELSIHDMVSLNHCSPSLSMVSLGYQDNFTSSPLTPNSYGTSFAAQFESVNETNHSKENLDLIQVALASPEHDIAEDGSESTLPKLNNVGNEHKYLAPPIQTRRANRPLCKSLSYQSGVSYKFQKLSPTQLANSFPHGALSKPPLTSSNSLGVHPNHKPRLTHSQRQQLIAMHKRIIENAQLHDKFFKGRTVYNIDLHQLKRVNTVESKNSFHEKPSLNRTGSSSHGLSRTRVGTLPARYTNYSSFKQSRPKRPRSETTDTSGMMMMTDEDGNTSDLEI